MDDCSLPLDDLSSDTLARVDVVQYIPRAHGGVLKGIAPHVFSVRFCIVSLDFEQMQLGYLAEDVCLDELQ